MTSLSDTSLKRADSHIIYMCKTSRLRYPILAAAMLTMTMAMHVQAQTISQSEMLGNDQTTDSEIRINPTMSQEVDSVGGGTQRYTFINLDANRIIMNGHSWDALAEKFRDAAEGKATVSVVHIGDSHVQPDGNTGRVRQYLQADYGNAGRGLMIPYRIAGTNQPLDYRISTTSPTTCAKLMRMPWPVAMGFTGIAVHPDINSATFSIEAPEAFGELRIYADGELTLTKVETEAGTVDFEWEGTKWGGIARLAAPAKNISLQLNTHGATIYGFDSRHQHSVSDTDTDVQTVANPGVLYHSIGNNGAAYSSYSSIGNYGRMLTPLTPDLVVLALGTNEAFGRTTDATMYSHIDNLVSEICKENPGVEVLLVTPSECQRSVYTSTRRGKKRRSKRRRSYAVNENVDRLRRVILRYGEEKGVPVYDFYEVAGGQGSSAKWLSSNLMSADRIHRTWNGYYLEGELFYTALARALGNTELQVPSLIPTVSASKSDIKPADSSKTSTKKATKKRRKTRKRK